MVERNERGSFEPLGLTGVAAQSSTAPALSRPRRVFCWCPDGEKHHDHAPDGRCPKNPVHPATFNLCGECGCITWAQEWTGWDYGEDEELVPATADPDAYRCPACEHDHIDDDSGGGVWAGTFAEMQAERARNVADFGWDEA